MYTTKKIKVSPTSELDSLASESGRVYSKVVSPVYKVHTPPKRETGKAVAIDMGEIHPTVSHDGEQTIIYNGRALRAIKQYINKFKAYIQSKMDRCIKRSQHWYHLKRIKTKILANWNKVSGFLLSPVVGAMASPIGVRFNSHLCKSG